MANAMQPTPTDFQEDQGPRIKAAQLTVALLASAGVVLRFWARYVQKAGYGLDDYFILVALPFGWGVCIATIVAVENGLGRHILTLQPEQLVREGRAFYSSEIIWALAVVFVKLSILFFYLRIFGRLLYVRWLAYGLAAFTSCWGVMVAFVCAFQCTPVAFAWNKSILGGKCIDTWLFFVVGTCTNVLTDYAILILPLPAIWGLHLSLSQKIPLLGIFMLGSLTCIFSTIRFAAVVKGDATDPTWTASNGAIWSTAEPCLGIVAGCLPAMRPLFSNIVLGIEKVRSKSSLFGYFSKGSGSGDSNILPSSGAYNNLDPLDHHGRKNSGIRTQISAAGAKHVTPMSGKEGFRAMSSEHGPLVERSVRWETSSGEALSQEDSLRR